MEWGNTWTEPCKPGVIGFKHLQKYIQGIDNNNNQFTPSHLIVMFTEAGSMLSCWTVFKIVVMAQNSPTPQDTHLETWNKL